MRAHDGVCYHTMVGTLTGTERMFRANGWGGTESHFGVGGPWGDSRDGEIVQWQDTEFSADANYRGNPRIISIETGDNFPNRASDIKPWTPKQLQALVDITVWSCSLEAHRDCPPTWDCRRGTMWEGVRVAIPPVLMPDSKPSRRGICYHRQGCRHSQGVGAVPGFLVAGGEEWSERTGKECPTPSRIAQIPGILGRVQARLKNGSAAPAAPIPEVDEVSFKDKHKLTEADVKAFGTGKVGQEKSFGELTRFPPATQRLRRELTAQIGALTNMVTVILQTVEKGGGLTPAQAAEAAREGAQAALDQLGDLLDGDDDQ